MQELLSSQASPNLQQCLADYGDETHRLTEFYDRHLAQITFLQDTNGLSGIGAAVLASRADSFQHALEQYQKALIALQKHKGTGRGPAAERTRLRSRVKAAHDSLNYFYQQEMQRIAPAAAPGAVLAYQMDKAGQGGAGYAWDYFN